MICRYKIHDQETNEVLIAVGDNSQFFESMGYTEVGEVEQAYDGRYFVAGYAPTMPQEEKASLIRSERDQKLEEVAWMAERHRSQKDLGAETTLTEEQYMELLRYMQDLRDVPQQNGFPKNIVWPELPAFLKE